MQYYGVGVNLGRFGHDRGISGRGMVQGEVLLADGAVFGAEDCCDVSTEADEVRLEKNTPVGFWKVESNLRSLETSFQDHRAPN